MAGFGTQPFGTSPFGGGAAASVALTATVELGTTPPRVRIDLSSSAARLTVLRLDPDGRYRKVRTSDDQPLPLSGGVATVWDYEAPYGQVVTYSTDQTGNATVDVLVDVDEPWLIHPGVPAMSMPVTLRMGSNESETWDISSGVFQVLERETPIVTASGTRWAPASSLLLSTATRTEREGLRQLLSDGSPLLMNIPPSLEVDLETSYIAVGTVQSQRPSGAVGTDTSRDITIPYQVVDRPAGGTQAWINWNTVATRGTSDYLAAAGSQYATWAEVAAAVDSWAELAAPTT